MPGAERQERLLAICEMAPELPAGFFGKNARCRAPRRGNNSNEAGKASKAM